MFDERSGDMSGRPQRVKRARGEKKTLGASSSSSESSSTSGDFLKRGGIHAHGEEERDDLTHSGDSSDPPEPPRGRLTFINAPLLSDDEQDEDYIGGQSGSSSNSSSDDDDDDDDDENSGRESDSTGSGDAEDNLKIIIKPKRLLRAKPAAVVVDMNGRLPGGPPQPPSSTQQEPPQVSLASSFINPVDNQGPTANETPAPAYDPSVPLFSEMHYNHDPTGQTFDLPNGVSSTIFSAMSQTSGQADTNRLSGGPLLPRPPAANSLTSSVMSTPSPHANKRVSRLHGSRPHRRYSPFPSSRVVSAHRPSPGYRSSPARGGGGGDMHSYATGMSYSPSPRLTPSSPRINAFASVSTRIRKCLYDGRLAMLLENASLRRTTSGISRIDAAAGSGSSALDARTSTRPGVSEPCARVETYLNRRKALIALDSGMVVVGDVHNKTLDGLVLSVLDVIHYSSSKPRSRLDTGPGAPGSPARIRRSWREANGLGDFSTLSELKLRATCHMDEIGAGEDANVDGETNGAVSGDDALSRFAIGDRVKALVISVDVHSEIVYASMNNTRMRTITGCSHVLGVVRTARAVHDAGGSPPLPAGSGISPRIIGGQPKRPFGMPGLSLGPPLPPSVRRHQPIARPGRVPYGFPGAFDAEPKASLGKKLMRSALFRNPEGISIMVDAFRVEQYGSCLYTEEFDTKVIGYKALRAVQNQTWADKCVESGMMRASAGDYDDAVELYRQALDLSPDHVKAMIAWGAAYAMLGDTKKALEQWERAAKICPSHEGLQTYIRRAREERSSFSAHSLGGFAASGSGGDGRLPKKRKRREKGREKGKYKKEKKSKSRRGERRQSPDCDSDASSSVSSSSNLQ